MTRKLYIDKHGVIHNKETWIEIAKLANGIMELSESIEEYFQRKILNHFREQRQIISVCRPDKRHLLKR